MSRNRVIAIIVSGVLTLGLAAVYFLSARATNAPTTVARAAAPPTAIDPAQVLAGPHLIFRSSTAGAVYGELAAVPLEAPDGPRAFLGTRCERAYAVPGSAVCLAAKRGIVPSYDLAVLDTTFARLSVQDLSGLPSRARMSVDGSLVATTTFVSGHSYAQAAFSTETIIRRAGESLGNIESWHASVDGRTLTSANRNFWGVTFAADGDTFYVTGAVGTTTWLMRGSIDRRTLVAVQDDAECPSLSPDGRRVAYKKRLGSKAPGVWRLAVRELSTGKETLLAEQRSVDDQVEWIDDDHLLYGLPRARAEAPTSDVWIVPADGSGTPQVLVSDASSPAVVR